MAWSRIESKFWQHPKFAGWKPSEKWALGELIGYCCEYRTEGVIPDDLALLPRSVTVRLLAKAEESGWVDVDEDGSKHIHDWHIYHPKDATAPDRMKRVREAAPRPKATTWKRTREEVFLRDLGVCADCGLDCTQADQTDGRFRWNADHEPPRNVLEERGDSIYDINFIVTRCHSCHSKRTRANDSRSRTKTEPQTEPRPNPGVTGSPPTNTSTNTGTEVPNSIQEPSPPSNESRPEPPEGLEGNGHQEESKPFDLEHAYQHTLKDIP